MSDSRDLFFLPINLMLSTSTGMQRTHEKNQRIIEVGHHPRKCRVTLHSVVFGGNKPITIIWRIKLYSAYISKYKKYKNKHHSIFYC